MAAQLYIPEHKCGIGAAVNTETPFSDMFGMAVSLQHRGYDGCGFSLRDEDIRKIRTYRGSGRVANVFWDNSPASKVSARNGIFSNRYRTTGDINPDNLQPLEVDGFAFSHNGNVFNAGELARRYSLVMEDHDSDTKIIAQMIRRAGNVEDGIRLVAEEALGAFNLVVMDNEGTVWAYRDPWGFHPLFKGMRGDSTYFASETTALSALHLDDYEIEQMDRGELWVVNGSRREKKVIRPSHTRKAFCPFEKTYFMSPDALYDDEFSWDFRVSVGERLAKRDGFPNDGSTIVVQLRNSGEPYAVGYSEGSGIPMRRGFAYNSEMGRFYMIEDKLAGVGLTPQKLAYLKNTPKRRVVEGKRVIVPDDSIVRGGTTPELVDGLFKRGAKEVHLRIGSPPIISPCHMGFNHSDKSKLRAAQAAARAESERLEDIEEQVRKDINPRLTSLHYLPLTDYEKLLNNKDNHCFGCFTGNYPFPLTNGKV